VKTTTTITTTTTNKQTITTAVQSSCHYTRLCVKLRRLLVQLLDTRPTLFIEAALDTPQLTVI